MSTVNPVFVMLANQATAASKMPAGNARFLAMSQVAYRARCAGYDDLADQLSRWAHEYR